MRIDFALAALLLAVSPAAAAPDAVSPQLQVAIERGALLYAYDEAAWHGTDDFLGNFAGLRALAGGYVVSGTAAKTDLAFYDKAGRSALYRASFVAGKLQSSGLPAADRALLTPTELKLIAAKGKAVAAFEAAPDVGLCNRARPNLTMLPPAREGGPVIVYLMTAREKMEIIPLGGHYSVEVAANGAVGPIRRFMKSCINSQTRDDSGKQVVAMVVSHLLDPVPTEIHVFSSLTARLPLYVSTPNGTVWEVEGAKVRKAKLEKPAR